MPSAIEDYALLSDTYSGALVGRDGSIDWLCLPRYDSASMFGALLGSPDQGRWLLAPTEEGATAHREYLEDTFVLKTRWTTSTGTAEVFELMPIGDHRADVVRRIHGISGTVEFREHLAVRFDYGEAMPWVYKVAHLAPAPLVAIAGPDAVIRRGPSLDAVDMHHEATYSVGQGQVTDLTLTWYPSHREPPEPLDVTDRIRQTVEWWRGWASSARPTGPHEDVVRRSLLVLRALSDTETGGIVAAATTSLPEQFGGERNWDYRYVWLRDASLTLQVLLRHGFREEGDRWRGWLLRAIAGDPADVQIMYGLSGERYLPEREIATLPGYEGASPVRVGNAASEQFQADVIGETMIGLHAARRHGVEESAFSWALQRALMGYLADVWEKPDQGIWEIRGEPRFFVHSRAMVWAALDRAVRGVEEFNLEGPVDDWRALRDEVRAEIDEKGVDPERGCFVQYYGSTEVDAAVLQLAQVGFCAYDDPRMLATVAAIESDLMDDGLVLRYRTEKGVDGIPPGENPFLACSFWLVEQYARSDRREDAESLFERLTGLLNDLGLVSEEYDPKADRMAGNFPQAFSHLTLVRASDALHDLDSTVFGTGVAEPG